LERKGVCPRTPTTEFLFDLQVDDVLKQVDGKQSDADLARCADTEIAKAAGTLRLAGLIR
jgi:hypothetical protein